MSGARGTEGETAVAGRGDKLALHIASHEGNPRQKRLRPCQRQTVEGQVHEILRRISHIDGAGASVELKALQCLRREYRPRSRNFDA
jgi:uncharacterized protein YnzC (UPF0291/DUF896 family)